jgi:adenylylsulfate kinase
VAPAFAIWLTGLPSSGKSTIAHVLARELAAREVDVAVLESDVLRRVLTPNPTYSESERETFYQSMIYIGSLLVEHAVPVIFDATANRRGYRAAARRAIARFVEVYVDCPLDVCVGRDPKGIYHDALSGKASSVPGMQAAYEAPVDPELIVSGNDDPADAARAVIRVLEGCDYLPRRLRAAPP